MSLPDVLAKECPLLQKTNGGQIVVELRWTLQ
jgi:hypothetical protein